MADSQIKTRSPHELKILGRDRGYLTGIEKVISSCESRLVLVSSCGTLTVDGEKLKINKFDADSGALEFEGRVNSVKYSGEHKTLLRRIFK